MRVLVIVKANKESEAGALPDKQLVDEMQKFNDELSRNGVMLAADGLHPSSKGKRVRFAGSKPTVIDGPIAVATASAAARRDPGLPRTRTRGPVPAAA